MPLTYNEITAAIYHSCLVYSVHAAKPNPGSSSPCLPQASIALFYNHILTNVALMGYVATEEVGQREPLTKQERGLRADVIPLRCR